MLEKNKPRIVVMGPVGSGKSTQARLLAEHFGVSHLEMGTLLRDLGEEREDVRKIVNAGKLIPDSLTLELLEQELVKEKYNAGFILDGVPRNLIQAQNLPFTPSAVIYLRVRDNVNVRRLLLRGRPDDTQAVIKKRLVIYHEQTAPVLDFYKKQGKLLEVNGEPQVEVIFREILKRLSSKLKC